MMNKKYYPCTGVNFMLLDKVEDQERRRKTESLSMEQNLLNMDMRSNLSPIKNQNNC